MPAGGLFVLIGSVPRTHWLPDEIERDADGFVVTGGDGATVARDDPAGGLRRR